MAVKVLNIVCPNLKITKADFKILTRDKEVLESLENDPFCANGEATAKFGLQFVSLTSTDFLNSMSIYRFYSMTISAKNIFLEFL